MAKNNQTDSPQFLDARPRFRVVTLEWPLSFGGKEYRDVHVVRLTAAEVSAFQEGLKALPADAEVRWPIYRDAEGAPIPDAVLDGLDDDDSLELDKAVRDFLPRRFRAAPAIASAPPSGEPTESLSAA